MQSTQDRTLSRSSRKFESPESGSKKAAHRKIDPKRAIEEIQSYIAIRDGLLAEAEKSKSSDALRRVSIANDFVASCLQPARAPYEAQFLPEADATRERKRCQAVRERIEQVQ